MSQTIIHDIKTTIRDALKADPYYSDVDVLMDDVDDLHGSIGRALKTRIDDSSAAGAVVVVTVPSSSAQVRNAQFGPLSHLVSIEAYESPELNRGDNGTGKYADALCRQAHRILEHYSAQGVFHAIYMEPNAISTIGSPQFAPYAMQLRFIAVEADVVTWTRVAKPTISPNGGASPVELTLACATALADIYYTTDDSFPYSGNTAATLYSAPFTVSAAATVKVSAFKTGLIQSNQAAATVT